ncbi:hypothetical protein [Endozoicomonas sp. Mp262]|uniref:hypothetical protein n=1 Tax=Endozoicomonas sp. Mp262 TaxID=2919499 RepID=UPI0021D7E15A
MKKLGSSIFDWLFDVRGWLDSIGNNAVAIMLLALMVVAYGMMSEIGPCEEACIDWDLKLKTIAVSG